MSPRRLSLLVLFLLFGFIMPEEQYESEEVLTGRDGVSMHFIGETGGGEGTDDQAKQTVNENVGVFASSPPQSQGKRKCGQRRSHSSSNDLPLFQQPVHHSPLHVHQQSSLSFNENPGQPYYSPYVSPFLKHGHTAGFPTPKVRGIQMGSGRNKPIYDVVIVHTGQQKKSEAATLKVFLEQIGFTVFLDYEMPKAGDPHEKMEWALKSCRHTICIVSKKFLSQPDPRAELEYASLKRKWMREHDLYESMWTILFDLTLEAYKGAQENGGSKLPRLPALQKEETLYLYNSQSQDMDWPKMCQKIIRDIRKEEMVHKEKIAEWDTLVKYGVTPDPQRLYEHSDYLDSRETAEQPNKKKMRIS